MMRRALDVHRTAIAARSLTAIAVLAAVGALAPAATARPSWCAYAHTPIAAATRAQLQRAVVCLVNAERRRHGLPPLRENARLNRSAQGWTNAMVQDHAFTHGADFGARISAVGFNWSSVGENIATGFRTAASVMSAWMQSPGHCQNILNPTWRFMGTGVDDRLISGYSSQPGTWTEDFGLWMGQSPASGNWGPADGCPY